MVASNVQSPQSGFSAAGTNRVHFAGDEHQPRSRQITEIPDTFERRAGSADSPASKVKQEQAFAWVKDLIAEARTNPHASLPELLQASEAKRFATEVKRRSGELLSDVRQTPALSGVLSKKDFRNPQAVPDDLDALISQVDQDMNQFDLMLHDLRAGKPVSAPVLTDDHPLAAFMPVKPSVMRAKFEQQNAELKARQREENAAQAKKYGIEDTPELRKELLAQGTVASEDEIPAFLMKLGVSPKA